MRRKGNYTDVRVRQEGKQHGMVMKEEGGKGGAGRR